MLTISRWFQGHSEKVPVALERYLNEIKRVSGVLNGVLEGREYLVGDRITYADLAFVTWQESIMRLIPYNQVCSFRS